MNMKKMLILFTLLFSVNIVIGSDENKDSKNDKSIINFDINNNDEIPLYIEDWMINDSIWMINDKKINKHSIYKCEEPLMIEDWMLNEELFSK